MLLSGFGGEPKICTFGILDKVTVVPTVGQTVGLLATGRQGTQRYYKLSDITYYLITNRYNARGVDAMRYFGRDFAGVSHNQYRTHSIAQ